MSATGKSILVVTALLIVMSVAWHLLAVESQSNWVASVVANSAFCVLLATSVYRSRTPSARLVHGYALATIVSIFLGIVAALVGAIAYESNHVIGDALMESFNLGYYPPGPDAPLEIGAILWGFSIAVLVSVGVATGVAMRKIVTLKTD